MDAWQIPDAERDAVVARLQRAHRAGQLDQQMLNERVEVALATEDATELSGLLADLPDLDARSWTPSAHQQMAPYASAPPAPYQASGQRNWNEWLRQNWAMASGLLFAALLLLAVIFNRVPSGSVIWIFIFVAIWSGNARKRGKTQQPFFGSPSPQPPPPQRPSDSYRSDDGGQWNQPPTDR